MKRRKFLALTGQVALVGAVGAGVIVKVEHNTPQVPPTIIGGGIDGKHRFVLPDNAHAGDRITYHGRCYVDCGAGRDMFINLGDEVHFIYGGQEWRLETKGDEFWVRLLENERFLYPYRGSSA